MFHGDIAAGALDHDDGFNAAGLVCCHINIGFERHFAAAAQTFIGGDNHSRLTAFDAPGQRVWRKAAKNDGVHRADAGAGQHGVSGFRDHRKVDRDPISGLDAVMLQDIGEFGNVLMQLIVGDVFGLGRVITFPNDCSLVAALGKMTVNTIVGDVGEAVLEPFDRDIMRVIRGVFGFAVGLEPIYPAAVFRPEFFRLINRGRIHFLVFRRIDMGTFLPFRRDGIDLV